MVNDSEKSTTYGTGIEEINLGFLGYTIRPYLTRIEACVRDSLIAPAERDLVVVEHNVEGLLRSNSGARAEYYSKLLQNGVMNRNEVRRKENLSLIDGGEQFTVQSNLVDLTKLGQTPAASPKPDGGIVGVAQP
jgi:HK97 family phage portal protein